MTKITPQDGIVIVTGASAGLGRALAVELCRREFQVLGIGRSQEALNDTHLICKGGEFRPLVLDIADATAVDQAFAQLGPISALINNAAVYPHRDFLDETPASFQATLGVNLGGVFNCSQAALRDMTQRGTGRILNVATFADLNPLPASMGYSVSKGAARILTRAMIADLADRFPDIVIGDWMPGMLQTRMGIPNGTPPEVSAQWGVALALNRDPALMGAVFEMGTEILPPRGLKGKLKDLILMRRRKPRVLSV
ncbi:MAG: SDR family oxidoreductase [Pelagimonas sp.]|jgi:NAD(P)-dependent dehydrogenase (short-subunit alcohol dehydrogenase family)|nr:SDR family oxidoreductase [Pelagimonas sp.]